MAAQHDPAAQQDPAMGHDPAAGRRPVGMVGTGNMGGRMTRRMVEAGHAVLAVDADPARIPACGATHANSLAELTERCDVIMLSLPDSPVIESVIRNPGGLLEQVAPVAEHELLTRRARPAQQLLRRLRAGLEAHQRGPVTHLEVLPSG